jgi:menaquinone-dependent protoporphyrinogen oxidase
MDPDFPARPRAGTDCVYRLVDARGAFGVRASFLASAGTLNATNALRFVDVRCLETMVYDAKTDCWERILTDSGLVRRVVFCRGTAISAFRLRGANLRVCSVDLSDCLCYDSGSAKGRIMAASILVVYATRYGSTREVAEAVGTRLRERDLRVEVRRAREVRSLNGFGAVVLGAPLYIGSLLREARKFLDRHRAVLSRMPVAVFALGPISGGTEVDDARSQLQVALAKLPWLTPVTTAVFVGRYDPARLRFPDSLLAALPASPLHGLPAHDGRDWDAIRAWADILPAILQPPSPAVEVP